MRGSKSRSGNRFREPVDLAVGFASGMDEPSDCAIPDRCLPRPDGSPALEPWTTSRS